MVNTLEVADRTLSDMGWLLGQRQLSGTIQAEANLIRGNGDQAEGRNSLGLQLLDRACQRLTRQRQM